MPVSCQDNISQCYIDSIISVAALFCRPQTCVDLILKLGVWKSPYAQKSLDVSSCLNPGTFALYILISMELITYVEVPVSSFTCHQINMQIGLNRVGFSSLHDQIREISQRQEEELYQLWVGETCKWSQGMKNSVFWHVVRHERGVI